MNNTDDLHNLLDEFEKVVVSLDDPTIINKFQQGNAELRKARQFEEEYLQTKKQRNDKLQKELDELLKQEKDLDNILDSENKIVSELNERAKYAEVQVNDLEAEYKRLIDEVNNLEDSIQHNTLDDAEMNTNVEYNPTHLKLAIYRGLGIALKMDADERINEALLTSKDEQDIRTISLNDNTILPTTKQIWNFIS